MPEIIYKTQAAAGYLTPLYDESITNQFTSPLQVLHNLSGSLSFATSSSYTRRWVMKMVKCRFNTQKVSNSFFRLPVTRRCFRLVMVMIVIHATPKVLRSDIFHSTREESKARFLVHCRGFFYLGLKCQSTTSQGNLNEL